MPVQDDLKHRCDDIVATIRTMGSEHNRQGMARYGIRVERAFGVGMSQLRPVAKTLGRDQKLAEALWVTGWHEARLLAVLTGEPARLTEKTMERWARDFDSWDIVDGCCGHLFDKTACAWQKAHEWPHRPQEFIRRAGFVMMCALAVHDKKAADEDYLTFFPLLEQYACDERNFVKKAVNWAIRQIGKRNLALNRAAVELSETILRQDTQPARWIARDALRELNSPAVLRRLEQKANRLR